jgi:6-phosphogluconolactonase
MKTDIRIFPDLTALSAAAAQLFVQSAVDAIRERGQFLVAFSGGNTPMDLYRQLVHKLVDWTRVHIFWGDERLVPPVDPENSFGQTREALLKHIPIPSENIHPVSSELKPDAAAMDYARVLKEFAAPPLAWPRFDLVLLGMGEDGHTASLFPGSPVEMSDPVITVTANYQGRPAQRITLTPMVINAARLVTFLVSGKGKADILYHVLSNAVSVEQLPAQWIHPSEGKLIWLVDEAAGSKITKEQS